MSKPAGARAATDATPAAQFFSQLESLHQKAVLAAHGVVVRDVCLAGRRIRLRFAGAPLVEPITRAFAHLLAPPEGEPDLTVLLWETRSPAGQLPPAPWGRGAHDVRAEIAGFGDEDIHTVFQANTQSLLMFDWSRRAAIYCTADGDSLPSYELAAPLRTIFHWWARRHSLQMVHGAVLARPDGCVLLAGASGVGKSSTALACLPSSLHFLADDYSLLEYSHPAVIHCVYNVGKVGIENVERMPFLRRMVSNQWEMGREKAVFYLREHMPEKLLPSAPLRAIVLPQVVASRDSSLVPATAAAALVALASSSHVQLPNAGAEVLRKLTPVVRETPCFRMLVGSDTTQFAPLLQRLLP